MQESVISRTLTPASLRNLFGMFTVQGFVTKQILQDKDCLDALLEDYSSRGNKFSEAYHLFLLYIRELLRRDKKSYQILVYSMKLEKIKLFVLNMLLK